MFDEALRALARCCLCYCCCELSSTRVVISLSPALARHSVTLFISLSGVTVAFELFLMAMLTLLASTSALIVGGRGLVPHVGMRARALWPVMQDEWEFRHGRGRWEDSSMAKAAGAAREPPQADRGLLAGSESGTDEGGEPESAQSTHPSQPDETQAITRNASPADEFRHGRGRWEESSMAKAAGAAHQPTQTDQALLGSSEAGTHDGSVPEPAQPILPDEPQAVDRDPRLSPADSFRHGRGLWEESSMARAAGAAHQPTSAGSKRPSLGAARRPDGKKAAPPPKARPERGAPPERTADDFRHGTGRRGSRPMGGP